MTPGTCYLRTGAVRHLAKCRIPASSAETGVSDSGNAEAARQTPDSEPESREATLPIRDRHGRGLSFEIIRGICWETNAFVSIASVMLESPRDKGSTVTPTHMHTNRDTQTRSHAHTYTCMQPHTYLVCYHTGTGVVC